MDRTREFLKLANNAALTSTANGSSSSNTFQRHHSGNGNASSNAMVTSRSGTSALPMTASAKAVQFNQRASEISKGIQATSLLLARLTALTRVQSMFSEGDDEAMRLTITVKNEVNQLKKRLGDLDDWLKNTDLGTGKDAKKHSELMVKNMEMSLHSSGVELVRVLEGRKSAMEAQYERKKMFGGDDDIDMGKPLSFAANSSNSYNNNNNQSNQQQQGAMVASSDPFMAGQMTLIPDHKYLRSRVEGVNALQSHIAELGQVMHTLATMVNEQDHLVDDITTNVDNANVNLSAGYNELVRYYNGIKGNRQLVQRLFFVLVAFMVFFMLFLA